MKFLILRYRSFLLYGLLMAVLIFILKWLQWNFLIVDNSQDIYMGLLALFFTMLGTWIALQLVRRRTGTIVISEPVNIENLEQSIDHDALKQLDLTQRELQVLQLMVKGLSNAEIGETLHLSVSTIKTHASNLFVKMDVSSRTKAIEKAKRLKLTD